MAFKDALSKFAKTVGDGAASATAKTEELLEVSKLKGVIHSEEEKIKKQYTEIGSLIYSKHKDVGNTLGDIDEKLSLIFSTIEESNVIITSTNEKLEEIKNKKVNEKSQN